MSDTADEDLSALAWPGFVDILSSVLIVFVFFVIIIASALYYHVITFKSKIVQEIVEQVGDGKPTEAKETREKMSETIKTLQEKVEYVTEEKEVLEVGWPRWRLTVATPVGRLLGTNNGRGWRVNESVALTNLR